MKTFLNYDLGSNNYESISSRNINSRSKKMSLLNKKRINYGKEKGKTIKEFSEANLEYLLYSKYDHLVSNYLFSGINTGEELLLKKYT